MITTEGELEAALSEPTPQLIEDISTLDGDVVVLGAGGKMGPTLSRMARRALDMAGRSDVRVYAVSRSWSAKSGEQLNAHGVKTVTADLSSDRQFATVPSAPNVVYMVGSKFGTSTAPHKAWTTNTVLAAIVARRFAEAQMVAFSTGNVYPLVPVTGGGSHEEDSVGPIGEYAMSCLGRERVLEGASEEFNLSVCVVRLNYAVELRYGVLTDVARRVLYGQPIDVSMGYVNVVWQRYASEVALRCFRHVAKPPLVLNVTGPETVSVRSVATKCAELLNAKAQLVGVESESALLSNAGRCHAMFGYPDVDLDTLVHWVTAWLQAGGATWDRPTKFERRDGRF
jgi:dTDP-4-dehydrorhamnose reductase